MAVSKAQQRATNKYKKANYDRMELVVPKGRKEEIKAAAAAAGESANAFINGAIDARMSAGGSQGPGGLSISPAALEAAREAAEAAGETLPVFVERAIETQAARDRLTNIMKQPDAGKGAQKPE